MKISILLVFTLVHLSCNPEKNENNLKVICKVPSEIKEASACEISSKSPLIWTVEDNHNRNILFGFDEMGSLQKELRIENVENNDWEDLTSDDDGNMYIGDFGNNKNERQNLAIYKINATDLTKEKTNASSIIQFYYPEQTDFPPKKKDHIFDVESFFFYQNKFYLFTKNRSSKFDGTTVLYEVDNDSTKKNPAKKIGSFVTCGNFKNCAVTSAAISPKKDKIVILSSDKVWVFSKFKGNNFFNGKVQQLELNDFSQKEGLCFKDENTLYITDESGKSIGSNLYEFKLK